jgi:bifunctional non-homologous end joining protein LigD
MYRFVVHEHHARNPHYDFRLEMNKVLKSWAIPKGPSLNPADKRLAILVEDHPVNYFDFEGIIPENNNGAGAVVIWDTGQYRLIDGESFRTAFESGKISLKLQGKILKGDFSLTRMKDGQDENWLLIKKNDPFAQKPWTSPRALTEEKKQKLKLKTPSCRIE